MIPSSVSAAVLDACVLYPMPVRDLLLHLADFELYRPKWTVKIQEEWKRNLLKNRIDIKPQQLQRTTNEMNKAFPEANVESYEFLIPSVVLPDTNDRHVLAAAIYCKADVIVTSNLKDFPNEYLRQFGLEAQHPDQFIANLIDLNTEKSLKAFLQQVSFLKNPPMTIMQVIAALEKSGLVSVSSKLRSLREA